MEAIAPQLHEVDRTHDREASTLTGQPRDDRSRIQENENHEETKKTKERWDETIEVLLFLRVLRLFVVKILFLESYTKTV